MEEEEERKTCESATNNQRCHFPFRVPFTEDSIYTYVYVIILFESVYMYFHPAIIFFYYYRCRKSKRGILIKTARRKVHKGSSSDSRLSHPFVLILSSFDTSIGEISSFRFWLNGFKRVESFDLVNRE